MAVQSAADRLKVEWRGLRWEASKPDTGVQTAARAARHALLADAARAVGARVLLMGHTADDIAEADWMREQGAPLGRLRDWTPSPAWPEGRGLMLLRPLLNVRRAALRLWLSDHGLGWIEDPANDDPRFLRSRARAAKPDLDPIAPQTEPAASDFVVDPSSGVIRIARESPWLGHALVCASGQSGAVIRSEVERLRSRLDEGVTYSSLAGTLIYCEGGELVLTREPGRTSPPVRSLKLEAETIWDGRFAFRPTTAGWNVAPAGGRRVGLSATDRQTLNRLPVRARGQHPVLFRDDNPSPVLASDIVEASCLVAERLRLATGGAQTEDDLNGAMAS